ncbi:MAG: hypothetical protein ACT4O6_12615 [Reyranella sp.]
MTSLWQQFVNLPSGALSFLGTLAGSSLGLLAILLGALFNARLNRRRDDRLRAEEATSLRSAVRAELLAITAGLQRSADSLDAPQGDFYVPDLAHMARVMPAVLPKLTLLDTDTIRAIAEVYVIIDQYCETLLFQGGKLLPNNRPDRHVIVMPKAKAAFVAKINRGLIKTIESLVQKLE